MKIISLLLGLLAVAFVQANEANKNLLEACMADRGHDFVSDVKAALEDGADINTKDEKSGQTALMAAVLRGKYNIVKYLLEAGADTTIGERMGYTPPHGAAFQGRPDVMRLLIDAGLDVHEYHNDGFAPLHRVCWGREQRHVETLKVLVEHGVPIDIKTKDGKTCKDMAQSALMKTYFQTAHPEL